MSATFRPPPPLPPSEDDGDRPPLRPEQRMPVTLTAVGIEELIVAAHDRLCVVQDETRRAHLWDAIHYLEAQNARYGLAQLTRTIATLDGYPS